MARIEKTVFISYRRSDVYTALAVYENLKNQGYDVFFDYRSISSGDFEQIITSNIRARAHFLLILTPTALDRLNEPGDWLRREIETAIDEKRNIVPLFFRGFRFGIPSKSGVSKWLRLEKPEVLTGKLKDLGRYNGLNVHEDYFEEAMHRLRNEFLNKPLETVLHPVSNTVQLIVREEKNAADKALEQIEDVKELVKQVDPQPKQVAELIPEPTRLPEPPKSTKEKKAAPRINVLLLGAIAGGLLVITLCSWAYMSFVNYVRTFPTSESTTFQPGVTETIANATPELDIGSTLISDKDGMTLLYVPAGEFTMGTNTDASDQRPAHTVQMNAFWIDKTEVTNAQYAKCVQDGSCQPPESNQSSTRESYYGISEFANFPVIYVSWEDAQTYCAWAVRRLPTEAEWEKSARGDDGRIYPWGSSAPSDILLNYDNNVADTTEVGIYPDGVSPYGALDMAGNVWEWVADWYDESYYSSFPASNPQGPASGTGRVRRGGSWINNTGNIQSADRDLDVPSNASYFIGFRCADTVYEQAGTSTSQLSATETPLPTQISISPTSTLEIGSTLTGNDGMTLLYVPAGEFIMGVDESFYDEETPAHPVLLDAYWIDQTEVTNAMYAKCVDEGECNTPSSIKSDTADIYYGIPYYADYPVIYVSWDDATNYCSWADRRLPTEAEWEKAASWDDETKTKYIYPWGNSSSCSFANYIGREVTGNPLISSDYCVGDTTKVGAYESGKSPYGAYDMVGNVQEWVADLFKLYPGGHLRENTFPQETDRVARGGSWNRGYSNSIGRYWTDPTTTGSELGFRCAMSATP